jgi:hypothetical protein
MKHPNRHRTGTLLALAVLLASMTTGYITICDFVLGEPEDGGTFFVSLKAGETAEDITGAFESEFYRFSLCSPVPEGVFYRINRDLRGSGDTSVDIITSAATPPGHYTIDYVEGGFDPGAPNVLLLGQIDLTVAEPDQTLTACFYYYGMFEFVVVNQPVSFLAYCSTVPAGRSIVQYKWWFNYNGNPSSPPSEIDTDYETQYTYTSAGAKTVRLVVRADNGDEAATERSFNVVAP